MRISDAKKMAKLSEWKYVIEQQRQSGQSIRSWCDRNHLTVQQFYYRLRLVREAALEVVDKAPTTELVRLTGMDWPVYNEKSQERSTIVVRYHATSIEFPAETDMNKLASLLKELSK